MPVTITLKNESLQGGVQPPWQLEIQEERSTLREIIRSRIIVDNKQVTQLDSPIHLTPESSVTFFKLVPLVGG